MNKRTKTTLRRWCLYGWTFAKWTMAASAIGVVCGLIAGATRIRVSIARQEKMVQITVLDDGCGFPPELPGSPVSYTHLGGAGAACGLMLPLAGACKNRAESSFAFRPAGTVLLLSLIHILCFSIIIPQFPAFCLNNM